MKLLPIIITIVGATASLYIYNIIPISLINISNNYYLTIIYKFFNGKYFIDVIVNNYIIYFSIKLGYTISKIIDRGIIELVGPYGFTYGLTKTSQNIKTLDSGLVTSYAVYMAISIVIILLLLVIPIIIIPIDVRLIIVIAGAFILFNKLYYTII